MTAGFAGLTPAPGWLSPCRHRSRDLTQRPEPCTRLRMVTASVVEAMTEAMCPRCLQAVFPDDTVAVEGSQVMHLDCRRPRDLIRQERALMFVYCWGHAAE